MVAPFYGRAPYPCPHLVPGIIDLINISPERAALTGAVSVEKGLVAGLSRHRAWVQLPGFMVDIEQLVIIPLDGADIGVLRVQNGVKPDGELTVAFSRTLFLQEHGQQLRNQRQHTDFLLCPHPGAGALVKADETGKGAVILYGALQSGSDALLLEQRDLL